MIATASLELSTRLQELAPEWKPALAYNIYTGNVVKRFDRLDSALVPAPDLDWLLGKLPHRFAVTFDLFDDETMIQAYWGQDWLCKLTADTPCDTACALLIKLIEEGVVKL